MNIVLGKYDFRLKNQEKRVLIFDVVRKKYVTLTPEESIRQHWLHYLIHDAKYPRSLIAVEMDINVNQLSKRCDLVAFDRNGKPFLIVECKSPDVKITQKVFDQIARYNLTLQVKYLVVSNGEEHFGCEIDFDQKNYRFIDSLPEMK